MLSLFKSIDWNRATNKFVVVDPQNHLAVLYLSPGSYHKLLNINLNKDIMIMVLKYDYEDKDQAYARLNVDAKSTPLSDWVMKCSSMFTLRTGWKVTESMIKFERNFKHFLPSYYRDMASWLKLKNPGARFKQIYIMSNKLDTWKKASNIRFVILYLKVASIAVLQFISGNPLTSTEELGKRIKLTNGLPAFLPVEIRQLIRSKDHKGIILISSLLASYKGMAGPGQPSLGAIESPRFKFSSQTLESGKDLISKTFDFLDFPGLKQYREGSFNGAELDATIPLFWNRFNRNKVRPSLLLDNESLPLIMTASPTHKTSFLGSDLDAFAWLYHDANRVLFTSYIKEAMKIHTWSKLEVPSKELSILETMLRQAELFVQSLRKPFVLVRTCKYLHKRTGDFPIFSGEVTDSILKEMASMVPQGKLATKFEAAGKVRIFAIGDYWSQVLLKPLHETLFRILQSHPCDATFDQEGAVARFAAKGYPFIASYDLKSATDLIPQQLYVKVLSHFTSVHFAECWMKVLTQRDYLYKVEDGVFKRTRYERGQPMGLLSSWASLAMVHHFIVFLAAHRVNKVNFQDYLVLGDDIVIGNERVALEYLKVCSEYGITVGIPKSFVSRNGFFQFASQNMLGTTNLSPISLKEVLVCSNHSVLFGIQANLTKKVEFIARLHRRGAVGLSLSDSLRVLCTFREWKKLSSLLSKGLLPSGYLNGLISLLLSDFKSYSNKSQINGFLAALAGEYGALTGTFKEDSSKRVAYLSQLCNYNVKMVMSSLREVGNLSPNLVSQVRGCSPAIKLIVENSILDLNSKDLSKAMKIYQDFQLINGSIKSANTIQNWLEFYKGDSEDITDRFIEPIVNSFTLMGQMESIAIERQLLKEALSSFSNVSRYALIHRSMITTLGRSRST